MIHHAPARERFTFIHERRDRFSAKLLCRVLVTDGANYRAWVRSLRKRRDRQLDERRLTELIFYVHTTHPAYGVLRVTRELQRRGVPVGRRIVARLMRENGIAAVTRRRRRNLTRPDAGAATAPDLIRREFTAPMPGLKLIGDISCIPTSEVWLYLAIVLDLCSKELVGYAVAPHMRASLVVNAITTAHCTGLVAGKAIMYTDRDSQVTSRLVADYCAGQGIRKSMGRVGSCFDNAAAETFFATYKRETVTTLETGRFADETDARRETFRWIAFYNHRRRHRRAGMLVPAHYEQRYHPDGQRPDGPATLISIAA